MDLELLQQIKKLNVLILEDDLITLKNIRETLKLFFNVVYEATDGQMAMDIFMNKDCHIHILFADIDTPKISGIDLIKKIRLIDKKMPVVMLTNSDKKEHLLDAIKLNLTDYIIKPLTLEKLFLVFQDIIQQLDENNKIIYEFTEEIKYNFLDKTIITSSEIYRLTTTEYLCLELLLINKGKIVTKSMIENELFDYFNDSDNFIKNLIYKLRTKIGKDFIINIKNSGYSIE